MIFNRNQYKRYRPTDTRWERQQRHQNLQAFFNTPQGQFGALLIVLVLIWTISVVGHAGH
jgi:hypothetical protein